MGQSKQTIRGLRWSVFLVMALAVTACSSHEDLAKERARRAREATGDIRIALVWQKMTHTLFFEGAELAADEINKAGGIIGRNIRTVRYLNESLSLERDRALAKQIVADCGITAVVGHYIDEGAIAASVTYEYGGLPFITPAATAVTFSQHGFQYVFRNTPSDFDNGVQLADFAKKQGYSRVLVIDDRRIYGKGLADIFHARASKIGIEVVARKSFDVSGKDFKPLFAELKKLSFDAIFLGGSLPIAGEVIKQARIMGIKVPFMGGNGIDMPTTLWKTAGNAADGTITPTVFHHAEKHDTSRAFSRKFFERYQVYPDTWAALGYDAIQVLGDVIRKTGTTVPVVIASHLRFLKDRHGVTGTYAFTKNGDVSGNINMFQVFHNGKFALIEDGLP
jgi:branched-chain amino acid transport system substrate-binding protein